MLQGWGTFGMAHVEFTVVDEHCEEVLANLQIPKAPSHIPNTRRDHMAPQS